MKQSKTYSEVCPYLGTWLRVYPMVPLSGRSNLVVGPLKVHKIENCFDSDFGICIVSLLVVHK